jgi:hypothetical protein
MTPPANCEEINKMADKPRIRQVTGDHADEQSLAQIREILFGEQNRQTADQLARIEARIGEQDAALRALLERQIARLTEAGDALRDGLEAQGTQQRAALDTVDSAIRELLGTLQDRLTLLDSDLQDAGNRLARSIEDQVAAHDRLQQTSVSRAQLAELLEGLARQLRTPPVE